MLVPPILLNLDLFYYDLDKDFFHFHYIKLLFTRSVGTFARALDCTSTVRQPSLHMSAAAASRDVTLVSFAVPFHSYFSHISNQQQSLSSFEQPFSQAFIG